MSNDNTPTMPLSSAQEKLPPVWWWEVTNVAGRLLPFKSELSSKDLEAEVARQNRYHLGEALEAGFLPESLFYKKDWAKIKREEFPPVIDTGGYIVVGQALHDVMTNFDLGGAVFSPVTLYKADHKTPYEGQFYILQVMARKEGFEPAYSKNWREPRNPKHTFLGNIGYDTKNDDVKVNPSVLQGADLWKDLRLNACIFLSDPLCRAIKAAGLLKPVRAVRCPIISLL